MQTIDNAKQTENPPKISVRLHAVRVKNGPVLDQYKESP